MGQGAGGIHFNQYCNEKVAGLCVKEYVFFILFFWGSPERWIARFIILRNSCKFFVVIPNMEKVYFPHQNPSIDTQNRARTTFVLSLTDGALGEAACQGPGRDCKHEASTCNKRRTSYCCGEKIQVRASWVE